MPQAVWTGDLSFGLVNIPVKLYTATSPQRVRFHQYEAGTGRRIRYRRVAEGTDAHDQHSPIDDPVSIDEWEPGPQEVAEDSPEVAEADLDDDEATYESGADEQEGDAEVPWEEIVKGYEIEPGRVVTVGAEELETVAPREKPCPGGRAVRRPHQYRSDLLREVLLRCPRARRSYGEALLASVSCDGGFEGEQDPGSSCPVSPSKTTL